MTKRNTKREVLSEYCDIYDARGYPLNMTKRLADIHRDGDWHRTFHCWILNPSIDGGGLVLQRRGTWKRTWPDKLDTSAAGHYEAGEGIEGGLRELAEELGVHAKKEDLIDVGMRVSVEEFEQNTRNHEFQDVRFLIYKQPIEHYDVQFPEVAGLVLIKINDGLAVLSGESKELEAPGFEIQDEGGQLKRIYRTFRLSQKDFIPTLDRFYYKVFILAKHIMSGEKYLHI